MRFLIPTKLSNNLTTGYMQALHNSIDGLLARGQTYVGVVSTRMFTDAKMPICSLIPQKLQLVTAPKISP